MNFIVYYAAVRSAERNEIALKLQEKEINEHNLERQKRWQHDINNLLISLQISAPNEETKRALLALGFKIGSVPIAPNYTADLRLNVTLANKANEARAQGVRLDVQIALPEQPPPISEELVRIFSNLIDNAVRAAAALPNLSDRTVEVECKERAGFLYISTRNKFSAENAPHGTGRGSEILHKLAEKYHGHFVSQPHGNIWTAQLALKLS